MERDGLRPREGTTVSAAFDPAGDPVAGIDPVPVTNWLAARATVAPPLQFELITGGHSNLTYRVTDAAGGRWVLRRPPLAHLLAGAHDMVREHHLLCGLADTNVPTPPVVGLCTDASVNGADFYVTDFVEGSVLRSLSEADELSREARSALSARLVECSRSDPRHGSRRHRARRPWPVGGLRRPATARMATPVQRHDLT